jgi:uncharacterized protein YrrD
MRALEALQRDVVSTSSADTIGGVDGFVIAAGPARIVTLRLNRTAHDDANLLDWSELSAFGRDAITVGSPSVLRAARDQAEAIAAARSHDLLGKTTLTENGDGLGTVTDIDFDPASGVITAILTDRHEIPGPRLLALGSHAAIFSVPDQSMRSTQG